VKTFAVLDGTTVKNVIVAESQEIADMVTATTCIEYTPEKPAAIGWVYDEATDTFSDPNAAEAVPTE
jgi:hypothetical protein